MTEKEMKSFRITEFDLLLTQLKAVKATKPPEVYRGVAEYLNDYRDHVVRASGLQDLPEVPWMDETD